MAGALRDEAQDKFRDECGVFGIFGHPDAGNLTYLGLYAMQHRGQESAGIAVSDGRRLSACTGMGLVAEVFDPRTIHQLEADYQAPANGEPPLHDRTRGANGTLAAAFRGRGRYPTSQGIPANRRWI